LCLIGPLLFGHDVQWAPWVWLAMLAGVAIIALFVRLERRVAARGGMPLIDLALLADARFMRGLCAAFFFFAANLSFYLVMTLFMQNALKYSPIEAGLIFVPLALAFVVASRHSGVRARHRGMLVLIEGCAVQVIALAAIALTLISMPQPSVVLLALPLTIFGYGQGLVMAPLSGVVLASVQATNAGAGSGLYGTTTQIANAAGVAVIGAVYFVIVTAQSAQVALYTCFALFALSIGVCAAFLLSMRRAENMARA
jgi:predicted MFS family arabinose efflux permease